MRIYSKIFILGLLASLFFTSCGSSAASAPPVDLPAPITGRITISNPDADGNVTITGTAGAVTADAMVMAVNEEVAGTVAIKFLGMIIKSAYAQTVYPSVCDEAGHACTVADSEGAFEMTLAAEIGDSIVIGIIDEDTGEFISDLLRRTVGEDDPTATCDAYNVDGAVVDVAIEFANGYPILLKQGTPTGTNHLLIGEGTPVSVSIGGCFAHSIAAVEITDGRTQVVVTSKDDSIVWSGRIDGTTVSETNSFSIDYEPMHVKFASTDTTNAIIALKSGDAVSIAHISSADGTISDKTSIDPDDGDTLTQSIAIDTISMESGTDLGVILTNTGSTNSSYLTLFSTDDMTIVSTIIPETLSHFIGTNNPADVILYMDSFSIVGTAILDSSQNKVYMNTFLYQDSQQATIYLNSDTNLTNSITWHPDIFDDNLYDANAPVQKIALTSQEYNSSTQQMPTVVGATSDGRLWFGRALNFISSNPEKPSSITTLASGSDLVAISIDSTDKNAFVADYTNGVAISASSEIW